MNVRCGLSGMEPLSCYLLPSEPHGRFISPSWRRSRCTRSMCRRRFFIRFSEDFKYTERHLTVSVRSDMSNFHVDITVYVIKRVRYIDNVRIWYGEHQIIDSSSQLRQSRGFVLYGSQHVPFRRAQGLVA